MTCNTMACQFPGFTSDRKRVGTYENTVEKRRPNNLVDLKEIIQEIWDNLRQTYIMDLFISMHRRMEQCIERAGDVTKY